LPFALTALAVLAAIPLLGGHAAVVSSAGILDLFAATP